MAPETFSSGYVGDYLDLEEVSGQSAVMHPETYDEFSVAAYGGVGFPLVCRVGNHHLQVDISEDVEQYTLGLTPVDQEATSVDVPAKEYVLVARKGVAKKMFWWAM